MLCIPWPKPWEKKPFSADKKPWVKKPLPAGEKKLDLTITQFGGDVKGNIDRWRAELGLDPLGAVGDDEYKKTVKEIRVDGKTVYAVDIRGVKKPGTGMMPRFQK